MISSALGMFKSTDLIAFNNLAAGDIEAILNVYTNTSCTLSKKYVFSEDTILKPSISVIILMPAVFVLRSMISNCFGPTITTLSGYESTGASLPHH